jgi:hypothetical protein
MVMTSLYNLKNFNDRLAHSRYGQNMTTPLSVRSRVAVFGDWTSVVHESTDTLSEKDLVRLDGVLKAHDQSSKGLAASLRQYQEALDPGTLRKLRAGQHSKVLTVVSDGAVTNKDDCVSIIESLRAVGIIVQGIGFGSAAQDIRVVCHDPADAAAAVVIDNVREATLVRHTLLMKRLSKL